MKQVYTLILGLLVFTASYATTITAVQSNNWSDKATWDLGRLPKDGDSIMIPVNLTVTIDNNISLNNVVIIIKGKLQLDNGKLRLNNTSKVIIESLGKITGQNSNDQITIDGVFKFRGTQGTQSGYSYADASTGSAPTGFVMGTLPVNFTSFIAKRSGTEVVLNWSTSEEKNNSHFEIEKSTDGRNWKLIGIIMGNVNAANSNQYGFTDKKEFSAVMYYRILQVDLNGQKTYSSVKIVRSTENKKQANVYVPSKNTIAIDINGEKKSNMMVTVVNLNGQVVARQLIGSASYKVTMVIPGNVNGIFVVNMRDEKGWSESSKVVF